MGLGKKIIDFIAPPIKQKIPTTQQTQLNNSEQETKKKQKIGVQDIEEIEYEILESNIKTPVDTTTGIPELETEDYNINQELKKHSVTEELKENSFENTETLSYHEYEQITKDIDLTTEEAKNELDIAVEDITSQYKIADIPLSAEENITLEKSPDIHDVQLPDNIIMNNETEYLSPLYPENALFENTLLTYIENSTFTEHQEETKFVFAPLEELSQTKKEITEQIDIEEFTYTKNLSHEKFIFSDNKKSITLPIYTSMQTELSNPIDYQPTDIQKITESISLEAPAMNALLKNAVRTIMQRKGVQEITPETLPLIKDDLSLVLEASGSNLSTMVGDVLQIKKIVNDKVNERRDKINEYKNELTEKISQLLVQVRHLEGEVAKLDNIIYTDIEELTKINKTLDTYQMLLTSISEQKFNFE